MKYRFRLRRVASVAALTFAWCALWGGPSVANVASGVIVATVVSSRGIGTRGVGHIRFRPLVRFGALVMIDLVVSTVSVAREVLTVTDSTDEAIIAVRVPGNARAHLLLLVVAITVTPGTAVVDVDPSTGTLYLHVLHADRRPAIEAHVRELAELACRALPSDQLHLSRSDS